MFDVVFKRQHISDILCFSDSIKVFFQSTRSRPYSQFQLLISWFASAFRHPTFSLLICSSALSFFGPPVDCAAFAVAVGEGFLC
jgi:hypothetical protein